MKTIHLSDDGNEGSSRENAQSRDLYRETGSSSSPGANNIQSRKSNGDQVENQSSFQISPNLNISDEFLQQSWWLEEDLDLQSFETSLFEPINSADPWFQIPIANSPSRAEQDLSQNLDDPFQGQHFMNDAIRKAWFTNVDESNNVRDTIATVVDTPSEVNETYDLDDTFRERAGQKLTTQPNLDPLPSTMYLVSN